MLNVIFDECLSKHLVKTIRQETKFFPTKVKIHHVPEYFNQGIKDKEWLSQLNDKWIVITADRGIKSKRENKLPLICKQRGIRCIILSNKLHNEKNIFKLAAILSHWEDILKIVSQPKGSQFQLRLTTHHKSILVRKRN